MANLSDQAKKFCADDRLILAVFALGTLVLHLIVNLKGGYGWFRDEFYYIACGAHPAFGYVDQPPLAPLLAQLEKLLLGDSYFAVRFLPAVAGALTVYLTGIIVRLMGGGRYAQGLAMLAMTLAPISLLVFHFFSMNAFDLLFWAVGYYLALKILLNRRNMKYWLWLGLVLGVGLMNKISVLFWGFGFAAGLLLTENRRYFTRRGVWYAAIIAFLLLMPYLIWQVEHEWATLEFMRNAAESKNLPLSPLDFLFEQLTIAHPVGFILILLGLYFFLFSPAGGKFRLFGWMYLAIMLLLMLSRGKTYYLSPSYPVMFAGGAVVLEKLALKVKSVVLRRAAVVSLAALFVITLAAAAPLALPLLPVEKYIAYARWLGMAPSTSGERHEIGKLPQHFADMFGWEEMAAQIAEVYHSLPEKDKAECAIWGRNYGEAGAVDFFSEKYSIPKAISGHNNYWIWGPGNFSLEVLIVPGVSEEELKAVFDSVEYRGIFSNEYVMPYENNLPIYVCRGLIPSKDNFWTEVKHFE